MGSGQPPDKQPLGCTQMASLGLKHIPLKNSYCQVSPKWVKVGTPAVLGLLRAPVGVSEPFKAFCNRRGESLLGNASPPPPSTPAPNSAILLSFWGISRTALSVQLSLATGSHIGFAVP